MMKRILIAGVAAILGAFCGAMVRQVVIQKATSEKKELVIAANPIPIVAGTIAGTLIPKGGPIAAFLVAANVAANTKTGSEARPIQPET